MRNTMESKKNDNSIIDPCGGKFWQLTERLFREFDLSKDETIAVKFDDFTLACAAIFEKDELEGNDSRIREIFNLFDRDKDGVLKDRERMLFYDWLRITVEPVNILLVVDVQNDFINGSLALRKCVLGQDGADVVEPINRLIKEVEFDKIIYSMDWHPENHISFYENLHLRDLHPKSQVTRENAKLFDTVTFADSQLEQILWPKHCVMNTPGAELHKDLIIAPNSEKVRKGQNPEMEAYSVFFDNNSKDSRELRNILSRAGATHLYVCGLAYDICVKETCLDGLRLGFTLALIDDCCRGIDAINIENTKRLISENGGLIIDSENVRLQVKEGKPNLIMSYQSAKTMTSFSSLESSVASCTSKTCSGMTEKVQSNSC